jgi:hypothetical protein
MIHHDGARRVVLLVVGAMFAVLGLLSLRNHAPSVDVANEWRAIYVGLWLAQAVYFVVAARNVRLPILGDLGALLLLGQPAGRLVSLAVDGMPSPRMWIWFALEVVGGVAILLVRPSPTASTS